MSSESQVRSDVESLEVRTLALQLLGDTGSGPVSVERIAAAVETAIAAMERMGRPANVDGTQLVREIESMTNVFVGEGASLDDERDHRPWLGARRGEIEWRFWERYRRYLAEMQLLPPASVRRIDDITDEVLGKLEDPGREGPWDRRGMVVGQVQSGKTANYIGLICKAADAGYKLIVVLAGVHNSLRSQTQLRLDQGFLGFDSQKERLSKDASRLIGVGRLPGYKRLLPVNSLTNSEERGDFNLRVARQVGMLIGSDPVLLVVKKNASILRNLIKFATELNQHEHPETGRMVVPGVPLLVIDDEADHASVNTKEVPLDENGQPEDDANPTRINALIRELIYRFEQTAYVGYTATPFANIFAYTGPPTERYGDDLFPRSFIRRLPQPSNHVGPAEVFGIEADASAGLEGREPLEIVRDVSDADDWIPPRHKKDWQPGDLPESLREALMGFVLVCAARAARGQADTHNSMLVHVTRFQAVQALVAEQIYDELGRMQDRLRYGDGSSRTPQKAALRELWERDFVPTTATFDPSDFPPLAWPDVESRLADAASRIETLTINGSAKDALTYYEHPDGISVVAIGGDKLSRGLTLEGLSVSYFLRASRMYDTLMQMGRWFGYRPGYLDLCRLYLPNELRDWYRDITAANEELLLLFDEMAAVGGTPEDFGLRVRKSPDGLLITARAKMRNGTEMKLSFDNSIVETIAFHRDRDIQARNRNITERFLERQISVVGKPTTGERGGTLIWNGVDGGDVADLLSDFTTHERARKANGVLLARYIRSCVANDELTDWTVALISVTGGPRATIAGHRIGLVTRTVFADGPSDDDVYRIRRIGSPQDEAIDLDGDAAIRALEKTRLMWRSNPPGRRRGEEPSLANGPAIRSERPRERGLLLLYPLDPSGAYNVDDERRFEPGFPPIMGFAVSFPLSPTAPTVDYVVNNNYWQMEMGLA
jgi:hypothetical protein